MSDILVVYYSRTGKTRMVAERLATLLVADVAEIKEKKERTGLLGFLGGIKDSLLKRKAELAQAAEPGDHRVVLIGMPIWASRPPPAICSYVAQVDLSGRTVCAFCTSDGTRGKGTFKALNRLLPSPLAETFSWIRPKPEDRELETALRAWAERLAEL